MQGQNPYAPPAQAGFGPQFGPGYGQGQGPLGQRNGKAVVVPSGAQLPPLCVKCGVPHGLVTRAQKFQFVPIYGRMFGLIGILLTRRTGFLNLPICAACNSRWGGATVIMIATIFGGILVWMGLGLGLGAIDASVGAIGFLVGFVLWMAAFLFVIFGVVRKRQLMVQNIEKDGRIYLLGVDEQAARAITGS